MCVKYKRCVAKQAEASLEVVVHGSAGERRYLVPKKLSGKELRTIINRYLSETEA